MLRWCNRLQIVTKLEHFACGHELSIKLLKVRLPNFEPKTLYLYPQAVHCWFYQTKSTLKKRGRHREKHFFNAVILVKELSNSIYEKCIRITFEIWGTKLYHFSKCLPEEKSSNLLQANWSPRYPRCGWYVQLQLWFYLGSIKPFLIILGAKWPHWKSVSPSVYLVFFRVDFVW